MTVADDVARLGHDFWTWRLPRQFRTSDDIPRVDRPAGWLPDFSSDGIAELREGVRSFAERWERLDVTDADVSTRVDHRLIGSAVDRVRWEVDVLRNWQRDAVFAVHQILGPWFDLLLRPPPFDDQRPADLANVLAAVPRQVGVARGHLAEHGSAPLARAAVTLLGDVDERLRQSVDALGGVVDPVRHDELTGLGAEAGAALVDFSGWLAEAAPEMTAHTAVGRDAFVWFLRRVALTPATPEDLLAAGRQEWSRAVAWEAVERGRNRDVPEPPAPRDADEQVAREAAAEQSVRDFYEREGLLSQPRTVRHYLNLPLPAYLAPLAWLGVTDDLTGDDRLDEDGVSYVPDPGQPLGYFYAANARDPRAGIVHEGAHYQQLALSWAHENPLRRRYYDSLANEGIAFYNEELMLQAGLFDDAPHTREVIWNFARLRALRVEVDVQLAIGGFDLDRAVAYFVDKVPMDHETAFEESVFYAANPGLAMSYTTGKLGILRLLADAASLTQSSGTQPSGTQQPSGAQRVSGPHLTLRSFHDYVWRNGNLPQSLLRWELLGDAGDIDAVDADPLAAGDPPTTIDPN